MAKVVMGKIKKSKEIINCREEASRVLGEIGAHQREIIRLETLMNDELNKVRASFEVCAKPLQQEVKCLSTALEAWCVTHREEVVAGGTGKTVLFPTGEVSWRTNPEKCTLQGVDEILAYLKEQNLSQFIRIKEEVNKEALLADSAAASNIKGVKITQTETFTIRPFEVEVV